MDFKTLFIFKTFEEAMNIHKKIFQVIYHNEVLTYAELYLLLHPDAVEYKAIYEKYGWTNLFGVKVELFDNMWGIKMPEIGELKN